MGGGDEAYSITLSVRPVTYVQPILCEDFFSRGGGICVTLNLADQGVNC